MPDHYQRVRPLLFCKTRAKKHAKLAASPSQPKDYGINTNPSRQPFFYSVSFLFFAIAALSRGFLFSFFSGFFLSSFKSVCEAQRSKS